MFNVGFNWGAHDIGAKGFFNSFCKILNEKELRKTRHVVTGYRVTYDPKLILLRAINGTRLKRREGSSINDNKRLSCCVFFLVEVRIFGRFGLFFEGVVG